MQEAVLRGRDDLRNTSLLCLPRSPQALPEGSHSSGRRRLVAAKVGGEPSRLSGRINKGLIFLR